MARLQCPDAHRSLGGCSSLSTLLLLLLLPCMATPCRGNDPEISLAVYELPADRPAEMANRRYVNETSPPPRSPTPGRSETRTNIQSATLTSRLSVVELPPDAAAPGVYKRPHHAFGYRWQAAESWMRDHGVEARTCYLPMVRLHTRLAPSGGASGTLWLYGRCTFD